MISRKAISFLLAAVIFVATVQPTMSSTCGPDDSSAKWSALVHEDNSIVSSVLYIPYMALALPWRLIDGIINPKPTSKATMPPAAHKAPPVNP